MRVVLDTNVVISAFLSPTGTPAQILAQWQASAFDLVVSDPLLEEYQRALSYERVAARHGMSTAETTAIVEGFRLFSIVAEPQQALAIIHQDPSDNRVLECAMAGGADFIVSGDSHLLNLKEYQGIQILSPAEFLAVWGR